MGSILQHIRAVKLSAYEPIMAAKAIALRDAEIESQIKLIMLVLRVSIATNWLGNFLALVTITAFTLVSLLGSSSGSNVTTAKVFTVITTIGLISDPLLMLGQRFSSLVSAWASFKRMEKFLLEDESASLISEQTTPEADDDLKGTDIPLKEVSNSVSVQLASASLGLSGLSKTLLRDIDINMRDFGLWMIIGEVGSVSAWDERGSRQGKSVLLQAILGEMDVLSGSLRATLGKVGFCSQDPWLRTGASIKDNITFTHVYEPTWYRTVQAALSLDIDVRTLAQGDETPVSSLSGGQKQRSGGTSAGYQVITADQSAELLSLAQSTANTTLTCSMMSSPL